MIIINIEVRKGPTRVTAYTGDDKKFGVEVRYPLEASSQYVLEVLRAVEACLNACLKISDQPVLLANTNDNGICCMELPRESQ